MEYFLLMVFLWQIFKVYIVQGVYMSEKNLTWENAIKDCPLATPTLTFEKGVDVVDFGFNPTEDVWMGYFKETTLFQYIGCQNKTGHVITAEIDKNSPVACLSFCIDKTSLVGLSDKECYCIPPNNTRRNFECTMECSGQKGIACGDSDKISVYRAVSYNGSDVTVYPGLTVGDCVRVDNKSTHWFACNESLQALCYRASNGMVFVGAKNSLPWINASNKCFQNTSIPARLQDSKQGQTTTPYWTGGLRSTVVYDFHSFKTPGSPTVQYLYLDKENKVQFASPGDSKKYLCDEAEEQSKDTGVSVGVSIAVVLVVGIVIVVVVILKRRNIICVQKPDKEHVTQEPQEQNDYSEIPDTALTNGKVEYTNSKKMKTLEHTYHRVEKQGTGEFDNRPEFTYNHPDLDGLSKTRSNGQSEDLDPGHYAHTYFVLENQQNVEERDMNDTYNVTGGHKFTDHQESDNVYNKFDDKNNATYDHMHKFVPGAKSKDLEAENTYDTQGTVMKTGNTPTARGNQVSRNVGEADESDNYHHIGVKISASTDNFYGAP